MIGCYSSQIIYSFTLSVMNMNLTEREEEEEARLANDQ
jgi:hypothetical protein